VTERSCESPHALSRLPHRPDHRPTRAHVRHVPFCWVTFSAFLAVLDPTSALALQAQPTSLRPLENPKTLTTPFSGVSSVRELADGRVLVVDAREYRLLLGDFAQDRVTDVGRTGDGPGEYRRPERVYPLAGDSSLVLDRAPTRWIVVSGARPIQSIPLASRDPSAGGRYLFGADARGRVLEVQPYRFGRPSAGGQHPFMDYAESLFVLARYRDAARVDTLRRIAGRFRGIWRTPKEIGGGRVLPFTYGNAMAVEDQAVMFTDGWVAVVYRDQYRLEWIRPDGTVHRRVDLPHQRIRVTEQEKRAAILRRYPRGPVFEPGEMQNWPAFVPSIPLDAVRAGPRGLLLIERVLPASERRKAVDVVDRSGTVVARLELGLRERVVGAGRGAIYTVTQNEDDEELLRRYPF
jgi:hypothetical protein